MVWFLYSYLVYGILLQAGNEAGGEDGAPEMGVTDIILAKIHRL
jgi:hypothetical protein